MDDRLPAAVRHLDVAAAGRISTGVLAAQESHLRAEAARGAYVVEAESEQMTDAARDRLAGLLGGGVEVAWSHGAALAFERALRAWPLGRGARVGTVRSDYSANRLALERVAAECGWVLVPLPSDPRGRITDVPAGLDLVTFPQVASQRGTAQPVTDILGAGPPVLLDVAQALGQVEVAAGCAGYVGTSRKWLCGPRGVGFLAVAPGVELAAPPLPSPYDGVRRHDEHEAHIAGRVGFATALAEWTPELLPVVQARAAYARRVLAETPWRVVEPPDEPSGITTLTGGDPVATRARLLELGLLVNAVPASRARDLAGPVLRVSTAGWVTEADLDALADALGSSF